MRRWVHRQKSTGKYAVSRGSWISYTGSLAEAKIYRNKNGGTAYANNRHRDDYEWVPVVLQCETASLPTSDANAVDAYGVLRVALRNAILRFASPHIVDVSPILRDIEARKLDHHSATEALVNLLTEAGDAWVREEG